jgi:tetrahydromethanopterin S-methyltransferase subunit G
MAVSEARRRDLYTGLDELLGTDRADTLMAYLPAYETIEVATKDDIRRIEDRLDRIENRLEGGLEAVNQRLDRFFLTQSAGLIAMVGTLIAALLL